MAFQSSSINIHPQWTTEAGKVIEVGIESTSTCNSLPTPDYGEFEATVVKVSSNMSAITRAIRDRRTQSFMDERYMSSEEALSLSPAVEDLTCSDEDDNYYDVDDLLSDIDEEVAVESNQIYTRSRSSSKASVVDRAIAVTMVNIKPTVVSISRTNSAKQSLKSRPTSIRLVTPEASPSLLEDESTAAAALIATELPPTIPERSHPPLLWADSLPVVPTAAASRIPPRMEGVNRSPLSTSTMSSKADTVKPLGHISVVPSVVPENTDVGTQQAQTKGFSSFKSKFSKLTALGRKDSPASTASLTISGPYGVTKQPVTAEMLAVAASLTRGSAQQGSSFGGSISSGKPSNVADINATAESNFTTAVQPLMTAVTKLQDSDPDPSSTRPQSHHRRRSSRNLLPMRTLSSSSTTSITAAGQSKRLNRLIARGADEREPTVVIPPYQSPALMPSQPTSAVGSDSRPSSSFSRRHIDVVDAALSERAFNGEFTFSTSEEVHTFDDAAASLTPMGNAGAASIQVSNNKKVGRKPLPSVSSVSDGSRKGSSASGPVTQQRKSLLGFGGASKS